MTKAEVGQLVAIAVACFPSQQERQMGPTAMAWYEMLGDLDYQLALNALKKVLATAKFFPSVAEVREAAVSLVPSEIPDAEAAWAEFVRARRLHNYMRPPECMKMADDPEHPGGIMSFHEPWDFSHPVIGQTVKAMWGSWPGAFGTPQDETLGVDRAQFVKIYNTLTKRDREAALLPPAVQEFAKLAGEKLRALPGGRKKGEGDQP